jgi:hypothetical protein
MKRRTAKNSRASGFDAGGSLWSYFSISRISDLSNERCTFGFVPGMAKPRLFFFS